MSNSAVTSVRLSPKKIHPLQISNDDHLSPFDDCVVQMRASPLLPTDGTTKTTSCTELHDEKMNRRQTSSLEIDEAEASNTSQVNQPCCFQCHSFLSIGRWTRRFRQTSTRDVLEHPTFWNVSCVINDVRIVCQRRKYPKLRPSHRSATIVLLFSFANDSLVTQTCTRSANNSIRQFKEFFFYVSIMHFLFCFAQAFQVHQSESVNKTWLYQSRLQRIFWQRVIETHTIPHDYFRWKRRISKEKG